MSRYHIVVTSGRLELKYNDELDEEKILDSIMESVKKLPLFSTENITIKVEKLQ